MKNRSLLVLLAVMLLAFSALPVLADAGPPGFTFPEQPGGNVATACEAVAEHALGGPGAGNASDVALAIVLGLYFDACLGL